MTTSKKRLIVVLLTIVWFGVAFAIAYSDGRVDSQRAYTIRIVIATLTAITIVGGIVRRDVFLLLMGAGLVVYSIDTFYPHRFLPYFGSSLILAASFVLRQKNRATMGPSGV